MTITAADARLASKKPQDVQKEDAMWLQKELINRNYTELATAHQTGPQGLRHLRAGQPERAADVLRLRAQPARDQCAAERHAQEVRQVHHGRRARRPVRGRVHLRQGRPRHDAGRRGRPDRRGAAPPRRAAALLHRLLHLHEVVRADPPQVRLRDGDAARALPGRGEDRAEHARVRRQAVEGERHPDAGAHLRRQVRHRPAAAVHEGIAEGRGGPGRGAAVGQAPALADRRLLRRGLLHRPDLHGLPRHAGGVRVLPRAARRDRAARARGPGPGHAGRRDGRGEVPPGRRGAAQLDQLPRLLEDVLRRGRGGRVVDLRQGRRAVRLRLPPRPGASARVAGRVLPGLLHEPEPAVADRHDLPLHRRVPGGRPPHQLDQELQQLLGRAAPDPARGGEADRQAGRLHRDRPRRPALLLRGEREEPTGELLPDGQAEAHDGRRRATCRAPSRSPPPH